MYRGISFFLRSNRNQIFFFGQPGNCIQKKVSIAGKVAVSIVGKVRIANHDQSGFRFFYFLFLSFFVLIMSIIFFAIGLFAWKGVGGYVGGVHVRAAAKDGKLSEASMQRDHRGRKVSLLDNKLEA